MVEQLMEVKNGGEHLCVHLHFREKIKDERTGHYKALAVVFGLDWEVSTQRAHANPPSRTALQSFLTVLPVIYNAAA